MSRGYIVQVILPQTFRQLDLFQRKSIKVLLRCVIGLTVRTDSNGNAAIDHSGVGNAKVIVSGTTVGSLRGPGRSSYVA